MIGHHTHLQENNNLPLWRAPAIKKKLPFFNMSALVSHIKHLMTGPLENQGTSDQSLSDLLYSQRRHHVQRRSSVNIHG